MPSEEGKQVLRLLSEVVFGSGSLEPAAVVRAILDEQVWPVVCGQAFHPG